MFSWLRRGRRAGAPPVPKPAPEERIYAIGDVHGRDDLLGKLLPRLADDAAGREAVEGDGRTPVLVFLGDLVDRGDHTREALDMARAAARDWARVVYLRGNHEAALLDFLARPETGAPWLGFGGRQTLGSYGVPVPKAQPDPDELRAAAAALARAMGDHVAFLEGMATLYRSGDVVCAHAGIDPARPVEAQSEEATLWGRSDFLQAGPPPGLRVVHGHWADPEPVVGLHRICVDTGAYYSGRLTAVRLDEETALMTVDVFDP